MYISRLFCSLLLSAACLVPVQAQLFTSSDSKRTAPGQNRTLRYQPDGEDFVIVNGNRKFTRALYGSNTGFRLETSDVPEFALYMPRMGGNLSFGVIVGREKPLVERCPTYRVPIQCRKPYLYDYRFSLGKRIP